MKSFIVQELAKPIIRRGGTVLATLLLSWGLENPQVDQIVLGASAFVLFLVDLLASYAERKVR